MTAVAILAGDGWTWALRDVCTLMCGGKNDYGEIGDSTTTGRRPPVFAFGFGSARTKARVRSSRPRAQTGQTVTVRYTNAGTHGIAAFYLGGVVHKASTSPRLVQLVRPRERP